MLKILVATSLNHDTDQLIVSIE